MTKNYAVVFFDLDNTLWDFDANATEALIQLHKKHQLLEKTGFDEQVFIEIYTKINKQYWSLYEQGKVNKETLRTQRFVDTFIELGIEESHQPKNIWQEYLQICPLMPHVINGALDTLEALSSNYRLGIITNGFEETQHIKIKQAGFAPFIEHTITSEKVGHAKPNLEIFEFALKLFSIDKQQCLYIGDTWETDVLGACNAGIDTFYFNTQSHQNETALPSYLGEINELTKLTEILL